MTSVAEYIEKAGKDDQLAIACQTLFSQTRYNCPIHNTPLEVIDCFGCRADISPLPQVVNAAKAYPYHLDIYHSRERSVLHYDPMRVVICPECDDGYNRMISG